MMYLLTHLFTPPVVNRKSYSNLLCLPFSLIFLDLHFGHVECRDGLNVTFTGRVWRRFLRRFLLATRLRKDLSERIFCPVDSPSTRTYLSGRVREAQNP